MKMEAVGIIFLYNRKLGTPEEMSKSFIDYFSGVSENLVGEHLLSLVDLKNILESKRIFWAGIKENFSEIKENNELIGKLAWKVFSDFSGILLSLWKDNKPANAVAAAGSANKPVLPDRIFEAAEILLSETANTSPS